MNLRLGFVLFLAALGFAGLAPGEESPAPQSPPAPISSPSSPAETQAPSLQQVPTEGEVRSVIREADGYASMGEDQTLRQARDTAFENARRQILKNVETFIQSKTQVEGGVLKLDIVESAAQGRVMVLEEKDLGVQGDQRYKVWIRAEVRYVVAGGEAQSDKLLKADAPLTVRVWTDKKTFHAGERITVFLHGNRDFYARVFDQMADGKVVQLLPNEFRQDNHFRGGRVYRIPDPSQGDKFELAVTEPYGQDQILVYAGETPVGEVPVENIGQGLGAFQGEATQLAKLTRGLKVQAATRDSSGGSAAGEQASPTGEFFEGKWKLTTSAK